MGKRALVCGDRNWTNREAIIAWLSKLKDWGYDTVIEGEAKGADSIARDEAKEMGFEVIGFPAKWDLYGKAAGPIRNRQMLVEGKPDLVLAFHSDIQHSKGTASMLRLARASKVESILVQ